MYSLGSPARNRSAPGGTCCSTRLSMNCWMTASGGRAAREKVRKNISRSIRLLTDSAMRPLRLGQEAMLGGGPFDLAPEPFRAQVDRDLRGDRRDRAVAIADELDQRVFGAGRRGRHQL